MGLRPSCFQRPGEFGQRFLESSEACRNLTQRIRKLCLEYQQLGRWIPFIECECIDAKVKIPIRGILDCLHLRQVKFLIQIPRRKAVLDPRSVSGPFAKGFDGEAYV